MVVAHPLGLARGLSMIAHESRRPVSCRAELCRSQRPVRKVLETKILWQVVAERTGGVVLHVAEAIVERHAIAAGLSQAVRAAIGGLLRLLTRTVRTIHIHTSMLDACSVRTILM